MIKPTLLLAATLSIASVASADHYLTIGDSAPSLTHVTWLKGQPLTGFEKGKVYVVEFWATWCGPCKENIPNLTQLAKKYAGSVSIFGIDIWEKTDAHDAAYMARATAFVNKEGDQMAYNVGADDSETHTANDWMKAAGEGGIPMSFVIGRDGKIAWMGHAQGLDEVLAQVLDGKYDVNAAKQRRALEVEAIRPVKEAMTAKEFSKALSLMDKIVAKRPEMTRYYEYDRYTAYAHIDLAKTKQVSEETIKNSNGDIGAYQMMCSVYASCPDLSQQAYKFGMTLIQQALAKKDRAYLFLSMAGGVSMSLHDRTKAIEYARQAVDAAQADSHAPAPFIEFLKRNVQSYEASKPR